MINNPFITSPIKSIQRGTLAAGGGAATISTVNMAKTVVTCDGFAPADSSVTTPNRWLDGVQLTSATQVARINGAGQCAVAFTVVEYA